MADTRSKGRSVQVPLFLAILVPLATLLLGLWTFALVHDRNPLPFPDRDYQVFSTSSAPECRATLLTASCRMRYTWIAA